MTYEKGLFAQAEPGIVSGSTIERKKMSTKTIYKRIALVAVASLGAGLLSVAPASAASFASVPTVVITSPTTVNAGTTAVPIPAGTAIVADLKLDPNVVYTDAGDGTDITYVVTAPNGTVITSSVSIVAVAAPATGITASASGAVVSVRSTGVGGDATGNPKIATLTIPASVVTMGGIYTVTNTKAVVNGAGGTTDDETGGQQLDGTTSVARGQIYVSGSRVTQGLTRANAGTATVGNVAAVTSFLPVRTAGDNFRIISTGVGSITSVVQGVGTTTGVLVSAVSGSAGNWSQGANYLSNSANVNQESVVISATSTVAGDQTITTYSIDGTTGQLTAVSSSTITWGATPVITVGTTTARVNAAGGTTADGTDTPIVVSRTLATQAANIIVTVRDQAGNALTGQTLSATISGSGLIAASATATAGTGNARAASVVLTGQSVGSIHVNADGTAGVGTITILVGTTVVATKTVTFFGAPATVTAVQNHRVLSSAGGAIGSNVSNPTGADIANTPSVILTVLDANGTRIPGLTVANISAVSSDPTVMSSTINIQENTAAVSGNTVTRTYNVQVSSAAKASGSTATLTFRVALGTTPETYISTAPLTYRLGGSVASVALSLDKASYAPGEAATATLTVKDAAGNAAFDGDHANITAAALSSSLGITSSLVFGASGTTVSSLGGVAAAKINAPATSGTWTISGTSGTGPITATEKGKALTASATVVAPANAEITALTTLVNSLIAKINALNKLVVKIQKKVRA
jgi:trimeric autotransporter adhesin